MHLGQLYVLFQTPRSHDVRADKAVTALRHTHGHWIFLVIRIYPLDRYCRLHQPRSDISHSIAIWPAHGTGKRSFKFVALFELIFHPDLL